MVSSSAAAVKRAISTYRTKPGFLDDAVAITSAFATDIAGARYRVASTAAAAVTASAADAVAAQRLSGVGLHLDGTSASRTAKRASIDVADFFRTLQAAIDGTAAHIVVDRTVAERLLLLTR